jgi:hypothetical protein
VLTIAPHREETTVKLTLLGTSSKDGECPTLYATDRDTYVVQGWKVTDPETAVEIPRELLGFAPRDTA